MDIIQVNCENLESEHICCAISDKKGETCVASKKAWLKGRISEGLVFLKLNVRGKAFIEYIDTEKAWVPIHGANYVWINCLWVSGQFKGKGYGRMLLEACIKDAKEKGKSGVALLTSSVKKPFLSDPKFLKSFGFKISDQVAPFFQLAYLDFDESDVYPIFKKSVKEPLLPHKAWVLYYSHQCPHTSKYAPLLEQWLLERGQKVSLIHIDTLELAQTAPTPFTTYGLFYNNVLITNEILSEKRLEAVMREVI